MAEHVGVHGRPQVLEHDVGVDAHLSAARQLVLVGLVDVPCDSVEAEASA